MELLIIVNPVSGNHKGLEILHKIEPLLIEAGYHCENIISKYSHHPYEITINADLPKYDAIGIIGGDGTMHEVINGMMDREDQLKLPIGLITAGTGNALMHDLDALDPIKATQNIINGKTTKIDLARIEMQEKHLYAFNIIGWGLPVTVNHFAERWRKIGPQRYNLASLLAIVKNPNWDVTFKVDDETISGKYSFFLACNTIHSGNGMKMAPKARLNDGKFDLLILSKASRFQLVKLFSKIFKGKHIHEKIVSYLPTSDFGVSETEDSILIVDGQAIGNVPFRATVIKQALEIFVR